MIFVDVEGSGLIANEALPLEMQPLVLEIGAIKTNFNFEVEEEFNALIFRDDYRVPEEVIRITGITDTILREGGQRAASVMAQFANFCVGETDWVGHNVLYDRSMIVFELKRHDLLYHFPFPRVYIDTRVAWPGRLVDWGAKYGLPAQTHRALDDARLLYECYTRYIRDTDLAWTR